MITGTLYFTNDIGTLYSFVQSDPKNNIIVAISQNIDQQTAINTNALIASVLTPTYECFMQEVNGNIDAFCTLYYEHLSSKMCMDYISAIFKALTIGKNVMLYATKDESETSYVNVFKAYLLQTFGICVGDDSMQFYWLQNYFINIAVTLYLYDLYTSNDLFNVWRNNSTFIMPDSVILKLINEFNPTVQNGFTINQFNDLFRIMAIGYNGKALEIPARIK